MNESVTEVAYGTIPFRRVKGRLEFLLIHMYGSGGGTHWAFPKGRPEPGESALTTAERETTEEVGVVPTRIISEPVFSVDYTFQRNGQLVEKTASYFLAELDDTPLTLQAEEVKDAKWLSAHDVLAQLTHENSRTLFQDAYAHLQIELARDGGDD